MITEKNRLNLRVKCGGALRKDFGVDTTYRTCTCGNILLIPEGTTDTWGPWFCSERCRFNQTRGIAEFFSGIDKN